MKSGDETRALRQGAYALLIAVAAGALAGRILGIAKVYEPAIYRPDPGRTGAAVLLPLASAGPLEAAVLEAAGQETWEQAEPDDPRGVWPARRPEPTPSQGSNDRSRWCTIRALVDEGAYVIGYRDIDPETGAYHDRGIVTEDGWQTIDKVLPPWTHDHTQTFYSSKPPFLPTLLAGEYWLLKKGLGWSITTDRWRVMRVILFTVNWLPFVLSLWLLARLAERYGRTDWGRLLVVAAGCFGTFLATFGVTLNNHTVAAWSALFALYPFLRIWNSCRGHDKVTRWQGDKVTADQAAPGEASPSEGREAQPVTLSPGHRVTLSSAWLFVVAGFFAGFTACNELPAASFTAAVGLLLLWRAPWRTLLLFAPAAALPVAVFLCTNYLAIGRFMPAYSEVGGPWYEYPGSYWLESQLAKEKRGIDWAGEKESRAAYAFHLLLGHHGFFSLTPIFLLGVAAMGWALRRRLRGGGPPLDPDLEMVLGLTLGLMVIVVGFYVLIAAARNYGGWTSGPRWLFWLTPLWLLCMLPAADWLGARRWGRVAGYLALAVSAASVSYPAWNPWHHPWIYDWMTASGWINY